jgi:hypothetical protein
MMFAQRFPQQFDGVISVAPAMSVASRATIAAAWDTQLFNAIAPTDASGNRILSRAFSNDDLNLVARSVLQACDAQDGLVDGMVQNTRACRFDPSVLQCTGEKSASCLSSPQVDALKKAFSGPKTSRGQDLYVGQPWDPGIATPAWRAWKLGTATTPKPNSNNTMLMSGALGFYFATPPDPKLDTLTLNFDTDPARLEAVSQVFDTYRDVDMNAFRQRGGKFMIIHGTADGIFSSSESVAYFESMAQKQGGFASVDPWARLFLVPGMNHCASGPATDRIDAIAAMVDWVEQGRAPQRIEASALPNHPQFANRTRPLCPYPQYARYQGTGNPEDSANFACVTAP